MKESPRARHLRTKYGITEAQFEELAARRDGRCWICDRKPKTRLNVDHEHLRKDGTGGEIRGLLCGMPCNRALDYRWTPEKLYAAYIYLRPAKTGPRYTGLFVPVRKKKRRKSK